MTDVPSMSGTARVSEQELQMHVHRSRVGIAISNFKQEFELVIGVFERTNDAIIGIDGSALMEVPTCEGSAIATRQLGKTMKTEKLEIYLLGSFISRLHGIDTRIESRYRY